ncbi:kinase-like protein, partial [Pholiota conissans]
MSKKPSMAASTPTHPPLGTLIDGDSLELVAVLGIGGYGVVYRAVETFSPLRRSYAVKCLNSSAHTQSSTRRQLHLREITLHQIASAHPSVVTLHRVVEDLDYTYIIMDYAPDEDLFTQILHKTRYLSDTALIKHVFLQILDAVRYCHSLGIYHRDLKPENVLCFDRGLRVAITDFGLATTDKLSKEFRTGSVYHMSPECQAGDYENLGHYSPMHNDIWSLGIILLNLVTGRNPWKSAMSDDPTYKAYQRDPLQFLPSVLPISEEFNNLLVQVLHIDWKKRMSLDKMREYVLSIKSFYSENVIFEGSLARCPWEAGLDLGNGHTQGQKPAEKRPVPTIPENVEPYCVFSMSEGVSEYKSQESETDDDMDQTGWDGVHSEYEYHDGMDTYDDEVHTPYETSGRSSYTSDSSLPATPSSLEFTDCGFDVASTYDHEQYYDAESTIYPSFGGTSASETTDDNRFASSVFLATPVVESKPFPFNRPDAAYMDGYRTQKRYSSPNTSVYSVAEYADNNTETFPPNSPNYFHWPSSYDQPKNPAPARMGASRPIDIQPPNGRGHNSSRSNKARSQNTGSGLFSALRFFPRSSGASWLNTKPSSHPMAQAAGGNNNAASAAAAAARMRPVSPPQAVPVMHNPWNDYHRYPPPPPKPHHARNHNPGNPVHYAGRGFGAQLRSTRDWIPG